MMPCMSLVSHLSLFCKHPHGRKGLAHLRESFPLEGFTQEVDRHTFRDTGGEICPSHPLTFLFSHLFHGLASWTLYSPSDGGPSTLSVLGCLRFWFTY